MSTITTSIQYCTGSLRKCKKTWKISNRKYKDQKERNKTVIHRRSYCTHRNMKESTDKFFKLISEFNLAQSWVQG